MPEIQIEIVNPNGTVSYRRPDGHSDIREALHTEGYHIRFTLPEDTAGNLANAGLRLAGISDAADTDEYAFGVNRDTRRMYIWCSWYTPTPEEYQRANDWAYNR